MITSPLARPLGGLEVNVHAATTTLFFAVLAAAAGVAPLTMSAADWKTPRTPWGDPDLQGVWSTAAEMDAPVQAAGEFGTRQWLTDEEFAQRLKQVNTPGGIFAGAATDPPSHWIERNDATRRTSVVIDPPDDRLPPISEEDGSVRPLARLRWRRAVRWARRCVAVGALHHPRRPAGRHVPHCLQRQCAHPAGTGYVAITYEMIHDTRIIPTDGRRHAGPALRQYFGESTGRWDGDTLVVDVTNFNGKVTFRGSSQALHLIERFRRIEKDVIRYEVTIDDPATWRRPGRPSTCATRPAGCSEMRLQRKQLRADRHTQGIEARGQEVACRSIASPGGM
jgi:hypothetical protein